MAILLAFDWKSRKWTIQGNIHFLFVCIKLYMATQCFKLATFSRCYHSGTVSWPPLRVRVCSESGTRRCGFATWCPCFGTYSLLNRNWNCNWLNLILWCREGWMYCCCMFPTLVTQGLIYSVIIWQFLGIFSQCVWGFFEAHFSFSLQSVWGLVGLTKVRFLIQPYPQKCSCLP